MYTTRAPNSISSHEIMNKKKVRLTNFKRIDKFLSDLVHFINILQPRSQKQQPTFYE